MNKVDPMRIISMIKNGSNPQELMINFLENNLGNSPMGANLLNLARNGQTAEIEQIARNLAEQRGLDFDKEFKSFRERFKL